MTKTTWKLRMKPILALAAMALVGCINNPIDETPIEIETNNIANNENNAVNNENNIEPDPVVETLYLDNAAHLSRISIALRGVRPTVEELEAVVTDPDALENYVDEYLESDDFGVTIREMHAEDWMTRFFFYAFPPLDEPNRGIIDFNTSVFEQPLRLIEHVVKNDRPYSEIVTADYTVANADVAKVWGLEYAGDGTEWLETRWPEPQRPHAGLLSESMVWIRHYSTPLNAQRVRANLVSKNLLCYDFLARDINVDGNVDLSDPDAVNRAVETDPACISCHQSLDPLANLFWTWEYFIQPTQIQSFPTSNWRPNYDIEHRPIFSTRGKGYFGKPLNNIRELGQEIANDPRFSSCTSRRFISYLTQIPRDDVPNDMVREHQDVLESSDFSTKALVKSIVLSDAFKTKSSDEDGRTNLVKVRPHTLSQIGEALAGFRWEIDFPFPLFQDQGILNNYGTVDLMTDTLLGYGVLAGGIDDFIVIDPTHEYSPSSAVVYATYAQEFAGTVVPDELGKPLLERRFVNIDIESADEGDIRNQLKTLHAKLFGELVEADGPEVDRTLALYNDAFSESDDEVRAWTVVVSAMMQSPQFLYY